MYVLVAVAPGNLSDLIDRALTTALPESGIGSIYRGDITVGSDPSRV